MLSEQLKNEAKFCRTTEKYTEERIRNNYSLLETGLITFYEHMEMSEEYRELYMKNQKVKLMLINSTPAYSDERYELLDVLYE